MKRLVLFGLVIITIIAHRNPAYAVCPVGQIQCGTTVPDPRMPGYAPICIPKTQQCLAPCPLSGTKRCWNNDCVNPATACPPAPACPGTNCPGPACTNVQCPSTGHCVNVYTQCPCPSGYEVSQGTVLGLGQVLGQGQCVPPRPTAAPSNPQACFYEAINYQGRSFCMNVGQKRTSLPDFNDVISSVRITGSARVTLWENSDYQGTAFTVPMDVPDLRLVGFNDKASSLSVDPAIPGACFFEAINFQGRWFCVDLGQKRASLPDFNKMISSMTIGGPVKITLWENTNYQGAALTSTDEISDLRAKGFNDRASSLSVDLDPAKAPAGATSQGANTGACGGVPNTKVASGQKLAPNAPVTSPNGKYKLVYQTDGNLVVYTGTTPVWASNKQSTPGYAIIQTDGNFVTYDAANKPTWASTTSYQHPGAWLAMQDDGNVVVYDNNSCNKLWASK